MKKIIAIIFSVALIALTLVSCNKETDVPEGMFLGTDNDFYTMFLPEGWEKIETGTDVTFAQAVSDDKLTNVTVNALYWTISSEDVDGETDEEKEERLFNEYYERYKGQLTGEYDQLGDGAKTISVTVTDKEAEADDKVIIKVGETEKTYSFKINGSKMELYDASGSNVSDLDGYITLNDSIPSTVYYYGVEYTFDSQETSGESVVYTGKQKAEGLFTDFKEIGEPRVLKVGDSPAKEYVYTAKYGDLYYKYYTTVIINDEFNFYYVITFTFPEIVEQNGDSINKKGTFEDSSYAEDMEKVVTNFIPKR